MKITCPESTCQTENDAQAEACIRCSTPLRGYMQLLNHPAHLFNRGLASARNKDYRQARDLFAAVVHWCPQDREARNALAMACFFGGDLQQAQYQWQIVLSQFPADKLAVQGIQTLQTQSTHQIVFTGKQQNRQNTTKQAKKQPKKSIFNKLSK